MGPPGPSCAVTGAALTEQTKPQHGRELSNISKQKSCNDHELPNTIEVTLECYKVSISLLLVAMVLNTKKLLYWFCSCVGTI